jgi:lauroyl/myristoyl acyltransferase
VLTARLAAKRDSWPTRIRHSGGDDVLAHIANGGSLIVTGGHFPWCFSVLAPLTLSKGPRSVMVKTLEPPGASTLARREALRLGELLVTAIEQVGTVTWVNWEAAADASTIKSLVRRLKQEGALAVLLLDAPAGRWDGFNRPFAGQLSRNLPSGPARIARAARAGLANVAVIPEADGTLRFHWSRLIRPEELGDDEGVLAAMNTLVDHLEWAVGKFRLLYGPATGSERCWDAAQERWV